MVNTVCSILILATLLPILNSEYIPPGPKYGCPKETDRLQLFPCVCQNGTDIGLFVLCQNAGLAMLSEGIGKIAAMDVPVELLVIKECHISHLFGPLFHRSQIRRLHIEDSPIQTMDLYTFAGVNRTLQELRMINTKLNSIPDAFKILGNLIILELNGHLIDKIEADVFANSNLAGRLERLHIVNGLLSKIPVRPFQSLGKLKTLDLHGNSITMLERNQFKGLKNADVLDLSHNNISSITGVHLADLTKLGWCNVSHNYLSEIPRGMFARNTLLKVLHLDNNRIKKLDTNSFKGMRYLRRLYLQDNIISDIGRGTFANVILIGTVDLARNQLTKVDYQMFHQLKYAEIINLAENQITFIDKQAFTEIYKAIVNISHNELTEIEPGAFQNCNNITLLDLSHNNLSIIKRNAFDEHSYPMEFQVSYNKFTDVLHIPIQNMTGMQILNASHNEITTLSKSSLPKSNELNTIDLSYNNISTIYNGLFQLLFSLRYLNLRNNALERIKPGTFGTIFTLLELDLSHNLLADVSRGGLASLASCRVLDVSHNYLTKIFQIPISLGELNIAYNSLTEIASNTWPTMNALLRLNLSSNQLADGLSGDSFRGLLTLQKLDLSNNSINRPPWESLNSMTSLQYLYMQNNNLTSLSKSSFGHLPTMFELDLSYNQIEEILPQAFLGMQQLIYLSVKHNQLKTIPNEAFKGLVALRNLDLSHNMLEKINNKTNGLLDDCLSIDKVDLSHNSFSVFTKKMFPSNPYIPYKLQEIDLSYNSIPVLTFDLTFGTKKLKKLKLNDNGLREIRPYVLGNLTELQILDLSNNLLDDLIPRYSDGKSVFPPNVTEIDVSNNNLKMLPVERIVELPYLKKLHLENNSLTVYDPFLVRKMKKANLEVFFYGNELFCDCLVRPLKHYLNNLQKSKLDKDEQYHLICEEPSGLSGLKITEIDEERLICAGNIENDNRTLKYGNTDEENVYDFISEPDLAFRDIQFAQNAIYVHWFVYSNKDIANVIVYIKNVTNYIFYTKDAVYNTRSLSIPIENITSSIKNGGLEICISAKNSQNFPLKWFENQCKNIPSNVRSWPAILNIDKRRLNKKNRRFYKSNVLNLVSDSILITLCIFLGVCLRKFSQI